MQHAFEVAITCAGFRVRSQIVWDKGWGGMGDPSKTFSPRHELAWFATRGRFRFPAGRPASVIRCNRPTRSTRTHPCEKPVDLLSRLVLATTRPGDLVVDPFCGSGASGVACVRTGRRFVGVEIDAEHARTARSRIAAARRKERCHAHRKRESVHRRHVRRRAGRVAGDV
ncbi:MAG: hypothetical protein BroJett004_08280 [Planctomycetota bacterium]|nr:MAG: hypothetical protein BroJett004_08280 [Planctomycetota bacterium]